MDTSSPAITLVFDHPRRHLWRRVWRSLATLAGAFLVVVGLTASIPAVPAWVAVLGLAAGWVDQPAGESWPPEDLPVGEILLTWAVSTVLAVGGLRYGLRLVRRHRALVLFLRRFGHDEAQDAVSFAVLQTIGRSWRIVTLDDEEMRPIGIPPATRRVFRIGELGARRLGALGHLLGIRLFPLLVWGMWGVIAIALARPAYEFLSTGETTVQPWIDAVEPYVLILGAVFERRLPIEAIEPTLPGLFAVLTIAAACSFVILIATGAALILAFPLSTVLFFLSSAATSVRQADIAKTATATTAADAHEAARTIAERSRHVFGPRLVVLRVAGAVWRTAVVELASRASIVLVDISEPTENVLWELEELRRLGVPTLLIGEHDRVAPLASGGDGPAGAPLHRQLLRLVGGRTVLAYTPERRGLKRFAGALRGQLLDSSSLSRAPSAERRAPSGGTR